MDTRTETSNVGRLAGCACALLALCGCWTIRNTPFPDVSVPKLPEGRKVAVQLAGFDATVTTYAQAYGYATVTDFSGPWYDGRGRYRSGIGTTTVSTTEYIPQTTATTAFRNRATDALERGGCVLQTPDPQYRVEVRFGGPYREDGDGWATAGWMVLTLFTADYSAQTWTAKLKIHEVKTGKLLFERDYAQHHEVVAWGPIPIFSPGACEATSSEMIKDQCLSSLTDQTVADAMRFFIDGAGR